MDVNTSNNENTEFKDQTKGSCEGDSGITVKEANYVYAISTFAQMVFGIGFGLIIFLIAYFVKSLNEIKLYYYIVTPIIEIGAVFLPVFFYFLISKKDYKKALRLNKLDLRHIFPLVIIGVAVQYAGGFLNYIVIYLLKFLGKVPTQEIPAPKTVFEIAASLLFIAVLPGICEELLARGVILRGYENLGIKRAIIISSFLFAVMHFDITNFVFPMFIGLILGYLAYRTNSIFSGMIVHFTNNAYGVAMLYFSGKGGDNTAEPSSFQDLLMSALPAAVGFVLILGLLYYIYKTTDVKETKLSEQEVIETSSPLKALFHWPLFIPYGLMVVVMITTIYKIINGID